MTSNRVPVKWILHVKVHGGPRHSAGILMAADVALHHGHRVEDMSKWAHQEFEPDLVIVREEAIGHRKKVIRRRVEVIDSHDPVPTWEKGTGFDELVKIHVSGLDMQEIYEACELAIP